MTIGANSKHLTVAWAALALMVSIILVASLSSPARSGSVDTLHTFTAGTPAVAAEVNANFAALQSAIETLQSQMVTLNGELASANTTISELQGELASANSTISTLQGQVSGINSSSIMALGSHLEEISSNNFALTGINLHLRNGEGQTESSNSLGNLIIGYNEQVSLGDDSAGRGGSHFLVVGAEHQWSQYGGIVVGLRNIVTGGFASVSGGRENRASGNLSTVSGGQGNIASALLSSISGGGDNIASGTGSSILGGSSILVDEDAGHYP